MSKPRSRGSSSWRYGIPRYKKSPAVPPTDPPISPSSARQVHGCYVASALAQTAPLLVVAATGREADDLTAELQGVLGDAVAMFPSWETLPHERLSPGRRHGRRADDAAAPAGPPGRRTSRPAAARRGHHGAVVAAADGVRPGRDRAGHAHRRRRGGVRHRHREAGRPGLHPGGHGRQARRVRGSWRHPRRLPAHRRAPGPRRVLGRRGVRDADVRRRRPALDPRDRRRRARSPCRAANCCSPTTSAIGPPSWPPQHPVQENTVGGSVPDMLAKLAEGIPVDGMEALLPLLRPTELTTLSHHLPSGTPLLICDPEKVRSRAADLIKTGREFLEASWSTAAVGGDAPIDIEALGASGFVELDDARTAAREGGHPWWTLSPAVRRVGARGEHPACAVGAGSADRTSQPRSSRCCAHTSRPVATRPSSPQAPARPIASSSSWPKRTRPQRCWSPARRSRTVSSACSRARCTTAW